VIKKFYGVVRLIFFPLTDFFLGRFWAFLDEGNSKTRLNHVIVRVHKSSILAK
jgi:hypothetical protein